MVGLPERTSCVRFLVATLFLALLFQSVPSFAFHESAVCIVSVQVVSTKDHFQITGQTTPISCQVDAQLNEDGWVQLNYPYYVVMIQLPADAKDGWLTYNAGRGYADYLDNNGTHKVAAFIFIKGWI